MPKPMHTDATSWCPLWRKKCVSVCHTCEWWQHVRGKHPQTHADIDHWACSISMMVVLSIENTQAQRGTTASVDEMRKEVRASSDQAIIGAISQINRTVGGTAVVDATSPTRLLEN